ncbi:MAG: hypothetical protein AAFN41_05755 [Planctomycetota bacterium]
MPHQRRDRRAHQHPEHGPSRPDHNLLPNPGFEDPSAEGPHRPSGWGVVESPLSSVLRTGRAPHTGKWALDVRLSLGAEGEGAVQLVCMDRVPVIGGSRLIVGGTFLREPDLGPADRSDHGPSIWIAGRWLRTSANAEQPIGHFMTFPGIGLGIGHYETRAEPVVAPADANALALVCVLAGGDAATGRVARVSIDSLLLRYAPRADLRTPTHSPARRTPRPKPDRTGFGPSPLTPLLATPNAL